ncbi:MAG: AraC family transcriptional regulator [Paramuribaculum sp.]|nr:helix-turn-helix transcriptional regulator [Bacteroides sp.]MBD5319829.1 helix-turn-helix transcriptional regulator [Bacteroides sp.]MDE6039132.1 AraC family transcriptional regulator [Paramuribaculum sp.]MDE6051579.1 AraC family transcriptional regulator [Paramuribaculum sp.]
MAKKQEHERIETVEAQRMKKYSAQFSSFGHDYVFSRVTKTEQFSELPTHSMKVGALSIIMCMKGVIEINVNMEHYTLTENTLMVFGSDCVFNVPKVDWDNIDAYVFVIYPDFLRDINFEINVMTTLNLSPNQHPLLHLGEEEVTLMSRYFDLIHYNTVENTDAHYVRSISRALVGAAVYQLMQFVVNHTTQSTSPALSRRAKYIKDFMQLVARHHCRERSVAFYASQLCITPKYLSMIVRDSTGRSAAEWIDDYVITEAKNLLKFSGKNIQQVAYELNFSNQSSFGKYFKHLTGVSPTKFQRQ